ncbi:MAG: hypothetical protein NT121_20990, partial [Chloroflexi bacterium]|nr:hypothetical protein [Chloroflexota bacterium]
KLFELLATPFQESAGDLQKKRSTGGILGVFLSAKGGAGTSSLCVNIARNSAMTNAEMDVAVMDLVLPIGSLASIVGYQGDFDLVTAASHTLADLNSEYLRRMLGLLENWRFRLLAGSPSPESADALDGTRIPRLIQALRQAFDLTFIDMGRSLSPINLSVIQDADVVVIVTGPDLSTITLTQKIWQYLQNQGVDPKRVYLLLNRSVGLEGFSKSDAERMIGMDIKATIPYMGGTLSLANNQHLPILIKMPNDTAAMMIDQISREILETARRNRA